MIQGEEEGEDEEEGYVISLSPDKRYYHMLTVAVVARPCLTFDPPRDVQESILQ